MSGGALVLAYFRQRYEHKVDVTPTGQRQLIRLTDEPISVERLHLALSHDGLRWTALNGNRPTAALLLPDGREARVRDPFIGRGPDGAFHLVATGGGDPRGFLYARSTDLIGWSEARVVPVMAGVERAHNVWAPEFVVDPETGEFFVFWSTSFGTAGWDDSRIWCARTRDFGTFSEPRVLLDTGYTIIDATIVSNEGRFFMVFKDERFGHPHGEHRLLRVAVADQLDGPYSVPDLPPVAPSITEGPALFRLPGLDRWCAVYDHCMADDYGASVSDDLLRWEPVADVAFPANTRHGSVVAVSGEEQDALLARFG